MINQASKRNTIDGIVENVPMKIIDFRRPDYFNLRNDYRVKDAAKSAIDKYGSGNHLVPIFEDNPLFNNLQRGLENVCNESGDNKEGAIFRGMDDAGESVMRLIPREAYIIWERGGNGEILRRPIYNLKNKYKIDFKRGNVEEYEKRLSEIPLNANVWCILTGLNPEGTVTKLDKFLEIKNRRGAIGVIEDGLGLFSFRQKGAIEYAGAQTKDCEFIIGGFDKALASNGAFIAYPKSLASKVVPKLNKLKYLTGLSYSDVAAASMALSIISSEEGSIFRDNMKRTKSKIYFGIKDFFEITGEPESPLMKILLKDESSTRLMYGYLANKGILTYPYIRESVRSREDYGIRLAIHPLGDSEISRVVGAIKDYPLFIKRLLSISNRDELREVVMPERDTSIPDLAKMGDIEIEELESSFKLARDLMVRQYPNPKIDLHARIFQQHLPQKLPIIEKIKDLFEKID